MELLKGQDLQKAMRQPPPMTLERKVTIIVQVLAGLAHAHQAGIVHRDIKPANIFINQDGTVKIMDFGVARLTSASMTGTGNIVGTADYMSPEQVKGSRVDGRSDVFSVGCMLYELLTGRRPFHSENLMAIFYKITHEEPNFDLIPAGPEFDALLPILQKALDKDLERALRDGLRLRDGPARAGSRPTPPPPPASTPSRASSTWRPRPIPPQPMTDPRGPTMVDGTVDLGSAATARARPTTGTGRTTADTVRPASGAATLRPGTGAPGTRGTPTVVDGGSFSGTRPATARTTAPQATVVRPQRIEPRRPAPAPTGGSPWLYVALGGLVVALVGAGGYIYLSKQKAEVAQVSPSSPPATPTPRRRDATAHRGAAHTPACHGRPAADLRRGHGQGCGSAAHRAGRVQEGRLRQGPQVGPRGARRRPGQQGRQGPGATSARGPEGRGPGTARPGRARQQRLRHGRVGSDRLRTRLAPWDGRFTDLINRVREAQASAQREAQDRQQREAATREQQQKQAAAGKINDLLSKADDAMGKSQFDVAIQLYDEALKLDTNNSRAASGKTSAIGARAVAQAAGAGGIRGGGKAFVPGKTQAQSVETSAGNAPPGFEESAGVEREAGQRRGRAARQDPVRVRSPRW